MRCASPTKKSAFQSVQQSQTDLYLSNMVFTVLFTERRSSGCTLGLKVLRLRCMLLCVTRLGLLPSPRLPSMAGSM